MPLAKLDLLRGYAIAFGFMAAVQAAVVSRGRVRAARTSTRRPARRWSVLLAVANALLGMALGLFCQRVRLDRVPGRPVHARVLLPQILLCGLFVPRDEMAQPLQYLADVAADDLCL